MLIGDTLTGRFVPARWRERISAPLRMLLAAPYLVFAIQPEPDAPSDLPARPPVSRSALRGRG